MRLSEHDIKEKVVTQRYEVGYVCYKGGGHFSLAGQSDHGACGSHKGAIIYMELTPDSMREPLNLEDEADSLAEWVKRAEAALENSEWEAEGGD